MLDPAADLVTFLAGASLGLTAGTNLFEGEIREATDSIPSAAVFVQGTSGPPPEPYLASAGSFWRARVRIYVRGAAGDNADAQTLAQNILAATHLASISGYIAIFSQVSMPEYLGADAAQRGIFLVLLEAQWKA